MGWRGDPQGPETHVAVALRLFVRGTACLVRELGAIPSCWDTATHTYAQTHVRTLVHEHHENKNRVPSIMFGSTKCGRLIPAQC